MKIYFFTILVSAFVFTSCNSSCGSAKPANSGANTAANSTTTANSTNSQSANIAQIEEKLRALSPSEVLKEFFAAIKRKDVETAKESLSAGSFPLLEENAEKLGVTIDQYLGEMSAINVEGAVQIRNEKISGDTATVEYKDSKMIEFLPLPFVKEENIWKISLDKLVRDLQKKYTEDMKNPPSKTK